MGKNSPSSIMAMEFKNVPLGNGSHPRWDLSEEIRFASTEKEEGPLREKKMV